MVDKDNTTIINGKDLEAIKARIKQIKQQIETTTSDYDKEKPLKKGLAKLAGGCSLCLVLLLLEVEMKEKR
ncbi:MAG: hypothetical protein R2771_14825 [Saprospiraceae bacterium]